jgi:putative copper export protein
VAWTAFLILILTGLANVHNAGITDLTGTPRGRTLGFKLILVAISGVCAGVHAFVVAPRASAGGGRTSRMLSAVLGAGSLVTAVAAAFYGVDIAEH